jgi:hypothetical protein
VWVGVGGGAAVVVGAGGALVVVAAGATCMVAAGAVVTSALGCVTGLVWSVWCGGGFGVVAGAVDVVVVIAAAGALEVLFVALEEVDEPQPAAATAAISAPSGAIARIPGCLMFLLTERGVT